jgi:hypothetical protein
MDPAERRRKLQHIFAACDLDGDGLLSEAEVNALVSAVGLTGRVQQTFASWQGLTKTVGSDPTAGLDYDAFAAFDRKLSNGVLLRRFSRAPFGRSRLEEFGASLLAIASGTRHSQQGDQAGGT